MAENLTLTYGYTAKDLAAVRAYVQRVTPATIARTYYDLDEDSFAATPSAMERHLRGMLDALVKVAIEHGSVALAEHLRASVKKHGEPKLTGVTFRMVTEAATLAAASPHASHSIGRWFRPRVASRLKGEGITTLGELVAFCNRRGGSWWRSIPRIGAGRAAVIVAWLRRHEPQLRLRVDADVDTRDPLVADEVVQVWPTGPEQVDADGAGQPAGVPVRLTLAPLERMAVPNFPVRRRWRKSLGRLLLYPGASRPRGRARVPEQVPGSAENLARVHQGSRALSPVVGGRARQGVEFAGGR
jgi:hypothetical protein